MKIKIGGLEYIDRLMARFPDAILGYIHVDTPDTIRLLYNPISPHAEKQVDKFLPWILSHESVHITINEYFGWRVSGKVDNIYQSYSNGGV